MNNNYKIKKWFFPKYNYSLYSLIGASLVFLFSPSFALANEPKASFEIVDSYADTTLKLAIKQAVGEVEYAPQSSFEAMARADSAKEAVNELLRSYGYYQARIDVDIGDENKPNPNLKIQTGKLFRISDPEIEYVGQAPSDKVKKDAIDALALKQNDPAMAISVLLAQSKAMDSLKNNGYADVKLANRRVIVDHANFTMHPIFQFDAGNIIQLGQLEIKGKTKVKEKYIQKIVPWKDGDNSSPKKLAELEKRLNDTGAFDAVNVTMDSTNAPKRNVTLEIADSVKTNFETTLSYSTNEKFSTSIKASRYNSFKRADKETVKLTYGQVEKRLETGLSLPHFKVPNQTLNISNAAFVDNTNAYKETGFETKLDINRRFRKSSYWSLGIDSNLARSHEASFTDPTNGVIRNYALLGIIGSFLTDTTNNPLNPTSGYKFSGTIEPAIVTGDANLTYIKALLQASNYNKLNKNGSLIFATRFRAGSIFGASIPELPAAQRFYVGGGGSVRGYEYQAIGQRYGDTSRTPVGGLSMFETSLELRKELKNKIGFVVFTDAGALASSDNFQFSDIYSSVGFGLRYDLGFAPVRFDIGFPLKRPIGDAGFQVYLGVGQSF